MPEYQENSTVVSAEHLTASLGRLTLRSPLIAAAAQPGQFVMAACGPSLDPLLRRPFSIHCCPGSDQVQLLIRIVGKGTRLLCEQQPGQSISLLGPLGRGFRLTSPPSVCLIGGGIGIAPLLFLAERLRQASSSACMVLLGAQTKVELADLEMDFARLGCRVQTATDDGSQGHHGLVTELLPPLLAQVQMVYTCGPYPMMATVADLCRTAQVACEVSMEAHMACGLGACLGCTIHGADAQYKHVCTHGPVFNAEDVAWTR